MQDGLKGLQISYNILNLPQTVTQSGTTKATYGWFADGSKYSVQDASGNGYCYIGSLIYSSTAGTTVLESTDFSGGRIVMNGSAQTIHYHHKDHLGSVRAITDGSGSTIEQNAYYPFGGRHTFGQTYAQTTSNRYKFNGKEQQTIGNLDLLDYGARMYDAKTARWLAQDPLAEKYYPLSAYNYCVNNPLMFVDPDGANYEKHIDDKNKTITIVANYYTNSGNQAIIDGMEFWNNLSGKFTYTLNDDEYTILFDLKLVDNKVSKEKLKSLESKSKRGENINFITTTTHLRANVSANTREYYMINYNPTLIDNFSIPHEIGHTLGMNDVLTDGLMVSKRKDRSHNRVTHENITDMMNFSKAITVNTTNNSFWSKISNLFRK